MNSTVSVCTQLYNITQVEAQVYYTMEEKCTEYVELARDHSQLYR